MSTLLETINSLKQENKQLVEEVTLLRSLIQQYQNTETPTTQPEPEVEVRTVTKIHPIFLTVQFPIIKELESQLEEMKEYVESLLKENSILYEQVDTKSCRIKELLEECEKLQRERDEYEYYANEFGLENESQKDKITNLQNHIRQLQVSIDLNDSINKGKNNSNGVPIIIEGTEKDLYSGEQKDIILSYIRDRFSSLEKGTRQYDVCKSILEANVEDGTRSRLKRKIMDGFRTPININTITKTQRDFLRDVGLDIKYDKNACNHPFLFYTSDPRYGVHISGTASDKRGGLNNAKFLTRILL